MMRDGNDKIKRAKISAIFAKEYSDFAESRYAATRAIKQVASK